MVGYQSKDTTDLYTNFESTNIIVKYVNALAKEPNRLFIFVWGKGDWVKCGLETDNMSFIEINKNDYENNIMKKKINPRNKFIKNKLEISDYEQLKKILIDNNLKKDDFKLFVEKYKTEKYNTKNEG